MPNRIMIFEAEKYQLDPEREPEYDIFWNKTGTYDDYTKMFKQLIRDVKSDKDLLYCWKAAMVEMAEEELNE